MEYEVNILTINTLYLEQLMPYLANERLNHI